MSRLWYGDSSACGGKSYSPGRADAKHQSRSEKPFAPHGCRRHANPACGRQAARGDAAGETWEKSSLLSEKSIVARQKTWTRKYGPDYNLGAAGAKDTNLGEANNRPGLLATLLGLFKMHDFVPKWMEVTDDGGTLFWLKIVKLVNNRYDLYDPARKELLASIKTIFSTQVALRLLDAKGNDNGEVVSASLSGVGNQSYFGFNVMTGDGRKMGDVTNEANAFFRRTGKRSFSGGKGYVGTIAAEFADDPKAKVLVLAVTLAARMEGIGVNQFDPMKA